MTPETPSRQLTTQYIYDSLGRQVSVIRPDGSTTSQAYDFASQLVSSTDANGNTTTYTYDDAGRRTKVTDALGHSTAYAYDDAGRTVSTLDAAGHQTRFEYDETGRLTRTIFDDASYTTVTYGLLGEKVAETDQAGVTTGYGHDALGRLHYVTNAVDTADEAITRYEYDELGNETQQFDANQWGAGTPKATVFEYDFLGRRVKRTLPDGKSAKAIYSIQSNKLRVEQRDFVADTSAHTTTVDYDEMGRVVQKTPGSSQNGSTVTFTYDLLTGQRASMADATGITTSYTYDALGRLLQKANTQLGNLNYAYDPAGNLTSITGPNGYSVAYHWDALNRLDGVGDTTDGVDPTRYTYDNPGNLSTVAYPNGIVTTYNYNSRNQLRYVNAVNASAPDTVLAGFDYDNYVSGTGLDWSGRALQSTGMRQGVAEVLRFNSVDYRRSVAYDNDPLGRLRAERIRSATGSSWSAFAPTTVPSTPASGDILYDVSPGYGYTSGYDAVGNRRSRAASGVSGVASRTYAAYDANDHLGSTLASYTSAATFDDNGNTLQFNLDGDTSWDQATADANDFENHLTSATRTAGSITMVYDGDGNRVSKTVAGVTTRYLVDDRNPTGYAQVLEELDGSSDPTVTYVYGSMRISQKSISAVSYYGYDGHNSVRYLTDPSGVVTD